MVEDNAYTASGLSRLSGIFLTKHSKQAGAELGQAQLKLELDFGLIE